MLREPKLTPTGSLLSFCTDVIMQVQCAAKLGRLPSVCSLLVSTTASEMERFKLHSNCINESDTPSVSIAQLLSSVQLSAGAAPSAVSDFVKLASEAKDTLLPYYGVPRLARHMFKPDEEVAASTLNGVNARFRALFNGFRVLHFPATEPLYQVLDGLHKPYQVQSLVFCGACSSGQLILILLRTLHTQAQVRNQQAQETSVGITRGARTLKGRLPVVAEGEDSVAAWKAATHVMQQTMQQGTFAVFKTALDKGLMTFGSSLEQFTAEASKLLSRRRLYRADGAAVRDDTAGDALSTPFLIFMHKVAQHMIDVSQLTLQDVANYEMYLFFTSCLLGTATLRDQTYRLNLIDDVYLDEAGHVCESIFAPLQLKVKACTSESGHLLTADVNGKESTLAWLIMICAVRPMRSLLHPATPSKLIWGMSGNDNKVVSKSAWANRIQNISKAYLGSPRTGMCCLQLIFAILQSSLH
jgi:hypothetical protein